MEYPSEKTESELLGLAASGCTDTYSPPQLVSVSQNPIDVIRGSSPTDKPDASTQCFWGEGDGDGDGDAPAYTSPRLTAIGAGIVSVTLGSNRRGEADANSQFFI